MKKPKFVEKLEAKETYLVDFKKLRGKQPEDILNVVYVVTGNYKPVKQNVGTTKDGNKEVAETWMTYELTKKQYEEIRVKLGEKDIEIPEWPEEVKE